MMDLLLEDLPGHLPVVAQSVETHYLLAATWLEGHLPRIGTLIACTTLSLYARLFTEWARKLSETWPFLLRVGLFVAVVGFGFATIIATVSPLVTAGLQLASTPYLVPTVFACFLVVGILAELSGRI